MHPLFAMLHQQQLWTALLLRLSLLVYAVPRLPGTIPSRPRYLARTVLVVSQAGTTFLLNKASPLLALTLLLINTLVPQQAALSLPTLPVRPPLLLTTCLLISQHPPHPTQHRRPLAPCLSKAHNLAHRLRETFMALRRTQPDGQRQGAQATRTAPRSRPPLLLPRGPLKRVRPNSCLPRPSLARHRHLSLVIRSCLRRRHLLLRLL